ncbi:MAG: hypothetical protein ACT4OD_00975 [Candidatus Nitrosotenuis sp.]
MIKKEITRLAKNQLDIEQILPRLTTDEISLLIDRIDSMMTYSDSNKLDSNLLQLKARILEEEYFREKIEVS